MLKEIFLLKGVWQHNRDLWPLTFSMHVGIYLMVGMLFLRATIAAMIQFEVASTIVSVSQRVAAVFALGGYLLGSLGSISLLIKRIVDTNLRPFNTTARYFNLLALSAVFLSGGYSWLHSDASTHGMIFFIKGLYTFDTSVRIDFPLALHLAISFLFIIYLPLTDMVHFVAKYFTYHEIRWDDEPLHEKMEDELQELLRQPVAWSAAHINADGIRTWEEVARTEHRDEQES